MKTTLRTLTMTGVLGASLLGGAATAQTPAAPGCGQIGTPAATPGMMNHGSMGGPGMSTPEMMQEVEFDQMYVDMMLPHHESIVVLAEVALPLLEDPRLQEMAQTIIDTQSAEQAELRDLREEWYGSPDPAPMDEMMMDMMMEAMPGMGSAEEQMNIMSAEWQVQTFCASDNYDLAFIEQTIPHHQMAIDSSEIAVEQAVHPELVEIAEEVITAQQAEIEELEAIRADLTGEATPAT